MALRWFVLFGVGGTVVAFVLPPASFLLVSIGASTAALVLTCVAVALRNSAASPSTIWQHPTGACAANPNGGYVAPRWVSPTRILETSLPVMLPLC